MQLSRRCWGEQIILKRQKKKGISVIHNENVKNQEIPAISEQWAINLLMILSDSIKVEDPKLQGPRTQTNIV